MTKIIRINPMDTIDISTKYHVSPKDVKTFYWRQKMQEEHERQRPWLTEPIQHTSIDPYM